MIDDNIFWGVGSGVGAEVCRGVDVKVNIPKEESHL